jgi:WD40 repeat protein
MAHHPSFARWFALMTIATIGALVEVLRQSRLLDARRMEKLTRKLQHRHSDPRDLAKDLVRRGWLTPQQINQLFTGRLPRAIAVPAAVPEAVAVPAYAAPAAVPAAIPVAPRRRSSRIPWLFFNLVGLAIIVGLGFFLYHAYLKDLGISLFSTEPREGERERHAEADLAGLRTRVNERVENHNRLRRELLEFRMRHAGTSQVAVAGELMAQLTSPLDQLARDQIETEEKYDELPAKVVAIFGEGKSRHWGPARRVLFSPDGTRYISAGDDRKVRVWSLSTHKEVLALSAGSAAVLHLGFTDRGKSVVAATADGKVTIWDGDTGQAQTFQGPVRSPTALAVTPTVRTAAAATADNKIVLWDITSGRTRATIAGHTGRVAMLTFAPSGLYLASASADRSARLIDVNSGETIRALEAHKQGLRCVAFSADSKTLATGSDDFDVILWDVQSGQLRKRLMDHTAAVTSLGFSPNNAYVAAGAADGTVRYWETDQERAHATSRGHFGPVWSVAYSNDGQTVASAGDDGTVRLWGAERGEKNSFLTNQEAPLTSVALTPDSALIAAACRDHTLVLWDTDTRKPRQTLRSFKAGVGAVAISPLGIRMAAGDQQRLVRVWELSGVVEKGTSSGYPGPISSLSFSPDDKLLAIGSADDSGATPVGQVRVLDLSLQEERFAYVDHPAVVGCVALSPDNRVVAGGYRDGTIKVFDLVKGSELATRSNDSSVDALAFTPDGGRLAAAGAGGSIMLYNGRTLEGPQAVPTRADRTLALAMAPDGKKLVSTHFDGWVIVWNPWTGERLDGWQLPGPVYGVAFATDSRHVVTANGNGTVYVIRLGD